MRSVSRLNIRFKSGEFLKGEYTSFSVVSFLKSLNTGEFSERLTY